MKQKLTLRRPPDVVPAAKEEKLPDSAAGASHVKSERFFAENQGMNHREQEPSETTKETGDRNLSSLVESFRNGEESAFKTLVELYQWRLYCSAVKILKSKDDAEEAVAQTFAIAFRERKKFRGEAGIYTYLWKICFSICYHTMLKSRRYTIFSLDESLPIDGINSSSPSENDISNLFKEGKARFLSDRYRHGDTGSNNAISKQIIKSALRQALAGLPRKYSRIIILKDFYDYAYEEIAQILCIPRGTVMSRLSRARHALKEALKGIF